MARRFADELGAAEDRMVDLALKTIRERLAKYLLALSDPDEDGRGVRVELEESRQETAEILGTTTEAICRTLAEFRSRRWISIKGPFVLIKDPERLRQLAGLPAASL
jgi:CRP-like cAMP-binding protein